MEQIITIELLGEDFNFKVDPESQVDAREVRAQLVDEVNQAASRFPLHMQKTNKLAIVVLAALNIAKRHAELRLQYGEFAASVSSRASAMDRMIASSSCY